VAPEACVVEFSLRLCIPNSTRSFKLDRRETGVTEVCLSSLDFEGLNLSWGNVSPIVPGAIESGDQKQALLLCTFPCLVQAGLFF
jgi:hypothetical protein